MITPSILARLIIDRQRRFINNGGGVPATVSIAGGVADIIACPNGEGDMPVEERLAVLVSALTWPTDARLVAVSCELNAEFHLGESTLEVSRSMVVMVFDVDRGTVWSRLEVLADRWRSLYNQVGYPEAFGEMFTATDAAVRNHPRYDGTYGDRKILLDSLDRDATVEGYKMLRRAAGALYAS